MACIALAWCTVYVVDTVSVIGVIVIMTFEVCDICMIHHGCASSALCRLLRPVLYQCAVSYSPGCLDELRDACICVGCCGLQSPLLF